MDNEKLKKCLLLLAEEFRRIADKNGIPYTLSSGTMIGAVRHGGFIPWDDDMDFELLSEDYFRFLEACRQDLDTSRFYLVTEDTHPGYAHAFAKLGLQDTRFPEYETMDLELPKGIFIDLFPLYNAPDNRHLRKLQSAAVRFLNKLLLAKCGYRTENYSYYKSAKRISALFSVRFLKKCRRFILNRYSRRDTEGVIMVQWCQFVRKKKWFTQLKMYPFEDTTFSGVADYDSYLSLLYGEYMTPPPEKYRVSKHADSQIDFGPYDSLQQA